MLPMFNRAIVTTIDDAEPFETFKVFKDGSFVLFAIFKLNCDRIGCPFAVAATQEVADSGEFVFGQQFAFKLATNKNIKPIAGLRPATFLVAGLLEHSCKIILD